MTELLFLDDSYLQTCDATVVSCKGDQLVLNRTVFYPTGGGQPHDTGSVTVGERSIAVTKVQKSGLDVVHTLEGDNDLEPGEAIQAAIDWDRRYKLMRSHTALHILCGVIWNEFGAQVTGANIGMDKSRMDFELGDLSSERIARIESLVNVNIQAALPVSWREIPRDEAFEIPDLIRTKFNLLPEHIAMVRIVEIEGLDLQADGGTHVRNTSEVGGFEVIGTRSKGRNNKRIEVQVTEHTTLPG